VDRRGLAPGRRYVYVVTATDAQGRISAPSERLAVPYLAAPRAPRDLRATPGDRRITLNWDPPAELVDGTPVSGSLAYVVLRGVGSDGALEMVTPGIQETTYVDVGLDNDVAYRYVLRAVRADPRVTAAGPPSDPVTASPADTTPPRPPSNLVVVPSPGALRLAWTASPDDDVALYAIYRASGAGGLVRVGTALAGTTTFIDRDVRAGTAYRYAVTAIDRARTPNESARSNEATASAP
jgi:fibronectin type 3 domain-containing protein